MIARSQVRVGVGVGKGIDASPAESRLHARSLVLACDSEAHCTVAGAAGL